MNKKLRLNIIYQSFYRILAIITPLCTSPYLSRVLKAENLGVYSYTLSICSYFSMFAALGTETYGTREIARSVAHEDKDRLYRTFWGIYIFQLLCSGISVLLYIGYICFFVNENKLIAFIQVGWIISVMLDINWFYFGIQEVKKVVIRNTIVRLMSVICIFVFVKGEQDLWIYALIMVLSNAGSQIMMWIYLPKYVKFVSLSIKDITRHIKPNLYLFLPLIGANVYWTMDKTMLGIFSDYNNTGYYYNADKVMNIPLNLIVGFGTVMLPHMTSTLEKNDTQSWKDTFEKSTELYAFMSAAMGFGMAAIAKEFVPIFFGAGYEKCILLIICFAPILIMKALDGLIKSHCLLPFGQEKLYTYCVFCGAAINLVTNYMMIPRLGALGALIGTGVTEFVVCIGEIYFVRKTIDLKKILSIYIKYFLIGSIMFVVVRLLNKMLPLAGILGVIIEVMGGAFIYLFICVCYWKLDTKSNVGRMVNHYIHKIVDK